MSSDNEGDSGVFLRETSGVVRNIGMLETYLFNIGIINVGLGVGFILLLGPAFYSSANIVLAIVLTTIFGVLNALVYYYFSNIMPRDGGLYIYLSRTFHPAIGFMFGFNITFWVMFFGAVAATYLGTFGFGTLMAVLSRTTESGTITSLSQSFNPPAGTFVSATPVTFAIATAIIVAFGYIIITGNERFFNIQTVAMAIAWIGTFTLLFVLLTTSREEFIANFNQFTNSDPSYQQVITIAKDNGWTNEPDTFLGTVRLMPWAFYTLIFGALSSVFAGEIQDVERTQFYGTWGATITCGVFFLLIYLGTISTMGYDFVAAVTYNYFVAPEGAVSAVPWIGFLGSIATQNILLSLIIAVGFLMWTWFWTPMQILYTARQVFSWSIDRVIPDRAGEVSTKYHTPIAATIIATVGMWLTLIVYLYVPITRALVGIGAIAIGYIFLSLAAVVFPYRRREMFENSPVSHHRIVGIPVMSIIGAINTVFMCVMVYFYFTDPLIGGGSTVALVSAVGVFVVGLLIYFIMRYYRRSQGIEIDKAFEDIPTE